MKAVSRFVTGSAGEVISYVQFSGLNCDQSELVARFEATHDRILVVEISLLMQMKFVGIRPPLSLAHIRAARQMDVMALAHWRDSACFFARWLRAEIRRTKTRATTMIGHRIRPTAFTTRLCTLLYGVSIRIETGQT
jgi:hypothetical protein